MARQAPVLSHLGDLSCKTVAALCTGTGSTSSPFVSNINTYFWKPVYMQHITDFIGSPKKYSWRVLHSNIKNHVPSCASQKPKTIIIRDWAFISPGLHGIALSLTSPTRHWQSQRSFTPVGESAHMGSGTERTAGFVAHCDSQLQENT